MVKRSKRKRKEETPKESAWEKKVKEQIEKVKYYYIEDNAAALEPRCDSVVHLDVPQVKEATTDNKGLRIDDVEKELGANGHGLDQCDVT
ncbi:hypothetical protein SETIT_3G370900v2 [Setaria italica]|uniref:Uncharacterized protein n=1 Tax=Setaria italica TaxID=4555 RepID=A0A368QN15_SETIT|nr:hypothetical protein SETIT_3G370900v2 [Setaria italica]